MKEQFTTERIRKKFKNNFDLCNFSIEIARNIIASGEQTSLAAVLKIAEQRADVAKN